VSRRLIFEYLPLTPTLPMNLDFNWMQPVLVYKPHWKLVITLALILTFSPGEKGQRLYASFYAVVRRANPVAGAWWFMGSMRELFRGNLSPFGGERESDANCATTPGNSGFAFFASWRSVTFSF
jgi:hypothetical protein